MPRRKGSVVYSDEAIIKAITLNRGLITRAAKTLGCTDVLIYQRRKLNPAIQQAIEAARESMLDTAEFKLGEALDKGEAWAICFTLKTIGKNRGYVERQEQTGKDGGAIETKIDLSGLTDAQLAIIASNLKE